MSKRVRQTAVVTTVSLLTLTGCSLSGNRVLDRLPAPVLSASAPPPRHSSCDHSPPTRTTPEAVPQQAPAYLGSIPASWHPPGSPRHWRAIVVHHSAGERGSASVFDGQHRARGWDELGYHFVIGNGSESPDGMVEVGSRWRKQKHGAHCKTPDNFYNDYGIGVCLVGNLENHPPTPAQMRSLRRLVLFLSTEFNIDESQIYGHRDLGNTKCPGRYMSVRRLASWIEGQREVYASSR